MKYLELFNDFLNKYYKDLDFKVKEITENDFNVFAYLDAKSDMDIPILVLDKKTNEIKDEILPPFTDDDNAKIIWEKGSVNEKEGAEMEENKIRTLLKRYGAEEKEIDNFMEDLKDFKEDVEEEDKPYLLNKENVELLKLTDEGKDLILNAPNMKKEELEEAIQNYIAKHKV